MTDQYRATPEQWRLIEDDARLWSGAFNCILELRARVEALWEEMRDRTDTLAAADGDTTSLIFKVTNRIEALERSATTPEPRPASAEAQPAASEIFPVEYADANGEGIRIIMEPADETGQVCWVVRNSRHVNPCHEFPTPEAAYAAHQARAEQQPADPASDVPLPLLCPGAHTIAECGGPCEDDFRLCDCGLLQPLNPQSPSSKRLWRAMEEAGRRDLDDNPHGELAEFYEAMIRAVADWLEARGNRGSAAELREEANRA
jgi:hypothetical protein